MAWRDIFSGQESWRLLTCVDGGRSMKLSWISCGRSSSEPRNINGLEERF